MTVFNKIIIVIILIFIVGLSIVGIFNAFMQVFKWSDISFRFLNPLQSVNPFVITLVLLLAIAFCIFIFVLEFYRKNLKTVIVSEVKNGRAMVTLESAANQIKESISKISGTADILVRVMPKSKGVILNIRAKICSNCNVPEKMQEIIRGASTFTINKLGIKVYKTNLTIVNLSNIEYEPSDIDSKEPDVKKSITVVLEKEVDEKAQPQSYNTDNGIKDSNVVAEDENSSLK